MNKDFKFTSLIYQKFIHNFADGVKKTLWFLARDAFLFILVLVLLSIVFGEFLFYNYVLVSELKELSLDQVVVSFRENNFKSVVKELDSRDNTYSKPVQTYQNPFN